MSLTKTSYSMIQGAVYNVLDFGADSTGATSSQTAIQAALNVVKVTGGDLFFPSGTYDVGSGVEILGTRRFRLFGTKNTVLKLTSVGIALKIQNCRDFVVELFRFETTNGVGSTALRTQWNPSLTPGGIYSTTNYVVREIEVFSAGVSTTNSFDRGIHISGLDAAARQNSEMLLEKISTQTNLRGFLVDGGNTANMSIISCNASQAVGIATTNYGWYLDFGSYGFTMIQPIFSNNLYDIYASGDAGKHVTILNGYSEGSRFNFFFPDADSSSPFKQTLIKNCLLFASASQVGDSVFFWKGRGTLVLEGNNFVGTSGANVSINCTGVGLAEAPLFVDIGNTLQNVAFQINGVNNIRLQLGGRLYTNELYLPNLTGRIYIEEGSNAQMGTAQLTAGTVTVANTGVTANSRIFLTVQSLGTVASPKAVAVTAKTAGISFVITSSDVTDTSTVAWWIVEAT